MSASPAASQVRRRPAPASQAARPGARPTPRFQEPKEDDALLVNLSDIPRLQESMDVEGFKPSLLSRMFDLFSPVKK